MKLFGVDRRMDHCGVSTIDGSNLAGDVFGTRHKRVNSIGGTHVPSLKIAAAQRHSEPYRPRRVGTEISTVHVPHITHWGMDVRNVQRAIGKNSFSDAVAA